MDKEIEIVEDAEAVVTTKKKRRYSENYLLGTFKTVVKNLDEAEMLDEADKKTLNALGRKIVQRFMSIDLFE